MIDTSLRDPLIVRAKLKDTQKEKKREEDIDLILLIRTSVLTVMDFTAKPANPQFLLQCDPFGTKMKSRRSFNTIRVCRESMRDKKKHN